MADLSITVDDVSLTARWTDDDPTTRDAVAAALPVSGAASRWGDELYFQAGIEAAPTATGTHVPVGALAYWPAGDALCLFWGPTPASDGSEPRAASPVAVVAQVDDVAPLAEVTGDATVTVERA